MSELPTSLKMGVLAPHCPHNVHLLALLSRWDLNTSAKCKEDLDLLLDLPTFGACLLTISPVRHEAFPSIQTKSPVRAQALKVELAVPMAVLPILMACMRKTVTAMEAMAQSLARGEARLRALLPALRSALKILSKAAGASAHDLTAPYVHKYPQQPVFY